MLGLPAGVNSAASSAAEEDPVAIRAIERADHRRILSLVAVAAGILLTACGIAPTGASISNQPVGVQPGQDGVPVLKGESGAGQGSYLATGARQIAFIRWTE